MFYFARADRGTGVWVGSHHHHDSVFRRHQPDGRQQLLHHQRLNDASKNCIRLTLWTL